MKQSQRVKLELLLEQEEHSLHQRLLQMLPEAAVSGREVLVNSRFFPHQSLLAHIGVETEALLNSALRCMELREKLDIPDAQAVAGLYWAACEERARNTPHALGPRRLAARLLLDLQALC